MEIANVAGLQADISILPSKQAAIQLTDIRVDYGTTTAVNGLTLSVPYGEIYGLIGPNGAGKTSSFKVLATLLEPTYGDVHVCGIDVAEAPEEARRCFGYMPDLAPVPTDLKCGEFLEMFAAAYGVPRKFQQQRVADCLETVRLTEKRDTFCKSLSRGMIQRLVLAKCLLHDPKVLLLDEPASGLDPASRVALRDTLRSLARDGVAVLISSHILSELSELCTQIGILNQGQLLDSGPPDQVARRLGARTHRIIEIKLNHACPDALEFLRGLKHTQSIKADGDRLTLDYLGDEDDQAQLLRELIDRKVPVRSFTERGITIEDVILNLGEQR
ncbi:MAG: ABC transporter ATP-binding protein [Opitutales bacterium]|jgi:ABC-2 type transport system ATP-binding protein|nr:ABC transporter ATP-binding protein [Opitutales bacterium]MDP4642812.1 ABC transporter ATP-binding protein [Opitutales bacterium]MDP4778531.1 ABC transporter ATP-binding protein [Opitutales bacterium]MDP4883709.1 ABC transporter ATP-binding protein [Opitutales bacterium]MDP5080947.1 ABC transporter ATP-binding protein [Opitutales bacterium]